ncbi:hypothetical protein JCM10212_003249 [Sporobolomyces blumeae]
MTFRHDLSPLPPSSTFSQSTPALSHRPPYGHNASSSSPPNDIIATPSDRYDTSRGAHEQGKQPQRRSVRIRTSSGGRFDSSPFLDDKNDVSSTAHFDRAKPSMPRATSGRVSQVGNASDPLALAHIHGITPDQFELAKQQVMQFLRTDDAAQQQQTRTTLPPLPVNASNSTKRTSSSLLFSSSAELGDAYPSHPHASTPTTSTFPYGQAPIARTPNASSALQRATFDAGHHEGESRKSAKASGSRTVRARPSFEDIVQRSAKRQMRGTDAVSSQVMQWAQEDETSSSEEDGPGLVGLLTASAHGRRTNGSPATGHSSMTSRLLPSPATFGGHASDVNRSPSLSQDGSQRRGLMDRLMTDRNVAAPEDAASSRSASSHNETTPPPASPPRRNNLAQHLLASPVPSKPSPSVLFSPDVAKLLRSELDELEANEVAGRRKPSSPLKGIDRSSDIVVDSSPFRGGSPFGSATSTRTRDVFSSEEPASKRARWTHVVSAADSGLVSPTTSAASGPLRAPSFCDSSPPASEHGSVTSRGQAFVSTNHPASAPDFAFGGVPSSSPTSSQHSEYLPTRHSRSSPGPSAKAPALAGTGSNASTTASSSSRKGGRAPAKRTNSAPAPADQHGSHVKPSWSYAALIGQAIFSTEERKMSLNDIYSYVMRFYPFYKKADAGWQNSIRHNLSLNPCFLKTARGQNNPGKGHLWTIVPGCEDQFADGNFVKRAGQGTSRPNKGKAAQQAKRLDPVSSAASTSGSTGRASKRRTRVTSPTESVASSSRSSSISTQGRPAPPRLEIPDEMGPPASGAFSPATATSTTPLSPPIQMPHSASVLEFTIPPPPLIPRPASASSLRPPAIVPSSEIPKLSPPVSRPSLSVVRSFSTADIADEVAEPKIRQELPAMVRTTSAPVLTTHAPEPVSDSLPCDEPASPTISRSTLQQLREPLLSATMSPPTSVYHRLAGPYQPLYGASSVQNRRALALLASPEAAGIMPAAHPFDRGASLLTAASQGSPRSPAVSFLPSPHIFAGSGTKRSRTESDKEDRGFASLLSPSTLVHTQSPVSSVRGGPRAPMSPVQASTDKLEPVADPEKKRAPGTRLLPAVNALVDASQDPFRSPPRHARNRSPSSRGPTSVGPLQAALNTPGKRPLGFSPSLSGGGWSSWNDPYDNQLPHDFDQLTRSGRSPWHSPVSRLKQW